MSVNSRTFQWFRVALALLPALYLTYLLRFWVWFLYPLPTNLLEFSTGVLLIWWLIGLWKDHFPRPYFHKKWLPAAITIIVVAITITTVLTVLHLDKGRAVPLGIWKGWFMAPLTYYFMLTSSFRGKKDLHFLIDITVGIIGLTAGLLLLQFFTGWFSDITATYDGRLVWPYLDPLSGLGTSGNYPAIFLAPFACMGFVLFLKRPGILERSFYGLSTLAMVIAIYCSKSYGAWLAIWGACSLTVFLLSRHKKRWIIVPLISLLLLGAMYWDQRNTEKFQYGLDQENEEVIGSGEERLNNWNVSKDLLIKEPLWGVGPGQFQRAFERQAPFTLDRDVSRKEINHALHPHNTFLMFWLSSGFFGVLGFVVFCCLLYFPTPKAWRWVFTAPMLYWTAHGLIDVVYWKNDLAFSFWLFAALMTIAQQVDLVRGSVQHGLKVGRELGFPTANIQLDLELKRPYGVYVATVRVQKQLKRALLFYGPRKTAELPEEIVCELTIFDFEGDLYHQELSLQLYQMIREPMEFANKEQLQEQIKKDVTIGKNVKLLKA
jgi:O-antigen ligase